MSEVVCRLKPSRDFRAGKDPDADAEGVAISAFAYLAGDPDRMARFLTVVGIEPSAIRTAVSLPGFWPGVLDYVASEEALVVGAAAHAGFAPELILRARGLLEAEVEEEVAA